MVHIITGAIFIDIRFAVATTGTQRVPIKTGFIASARRTPDPQTKWQIEQQEIPVVTLGKHLHLKVAGQPAIGGELTEQHSAILVRNAVRIPVEDVPHPTNQVIDDEVASWLTATRLKRQAPTLIG